MIFSHAIAAVIAALFLAAPAPGSAQNASQSDPVYEKSIVELQSAMAARRTTSAQLVDAYLARIAAYDQQGPKLNSMLFLNPNAKAEAAALDAERAAGRVRGPLHGIPIILKDNFNTRDMPTTAASIALKGMQPNSDAFQVRKLRDAGAVILGKANMQELASGITGISSLGGQTCNPYDVTRNPGGSSSGSAAAVAANFAAISWGSDTCGSIRIPAAFNNLFGLRPTKGLSSIAGIIPLAHTQDVAGPLARTVTDLAIGLDATIGADPADSATRTLRGRTLPRFVASLDSNALRGARFGIVTAYFGSQPADEEATLVIRAAIEQLRKQGAEAIEVVIPRLDSLTQGVSVIDYEFKFDLMDYLAGIPGAPVKSLSEILQRGLFHAAIGNSHRRRDSVGTRDGAPYRAALARRVTTTDAIVKFLDDNRLDAIIYPSVRRKPALIGESQAGSNCTLSAITGLPSLSMPAGFTTDSLPIGVELLGRPLADARLLAFAYDYEQAAHPRRPPRTTPPLSSGR